MKSQKLTPATKLAITLLNASTVYQLKQVDYDVDVRDHGSWKQGSLHIYSTDAVSGSLHSLFALVTLFGEGVFSQYVHYNHDLNRCELVVYSYRLDEPQDRAE